jgi:hypothetical protein
MGAFAASPSATACTRWASARGSDRASGTVAAPYRTIHRLLDALPDGGVGCLVGGAWFHERATIVRPVTLVSGRGRATIVGGVTVQPTARRVVVRGLAIRGRGGARATVIVRADGARILDNDVSGPGFYDRATRCILVDGARDAVVDGNRIHNCTRATRRNLYAPGIHVASALRARIANNVVFHTLGDAIVLAPNAQRTLVTRNIVDGNVSGIYIGGNRRTASSYNVVTRNIVSNSGHWNVHSAWRGRVGVGNVISSNCFWHGFGGNVVGDGLTASDNVVASPRYRHRPTDFTLLGGPCRSLRPRIVGALLPRLPRFTISYRLRALPARVQVVRLTLTGLAAGARVSVRCKRGCRVGWSGRAFRSTLALPVLRGTWLRVGAVFEVREARASWVGHVARVTVTGLPRGVRIEHRSA